MTNILYVASTRERALKKLRELARVCEYDGIPYTLKERDLTIEFYGTKYTCKTINNLDKIRGIEITHAAFEDHLELSEQEIALIKSRIRK